MSKAYYYCKNFSFREVNNLFAYSTKDPSHLSQDQRITRLYKGMIRKLMAQHVFTIRRCNFDRFHDEQARVRRDFDKIYAKDADPKLVELTLEKYELYIEKYFEPYAAMHACRPHSNLWGKDVGWGDKALATDHIGYYSGNVLVNGQPSQVAFHEEYPHMTTAWIYDEMYLDAEFNYDDLEAQYLAEQSSSGERAADVKARLDEARL